MEHDHRARDRLGREQILEVPFHPRGGMIAIDENEIDVPAPPAEVEQELRQEHVIVSPMERHVRRLVRDPRCEVEAVDFPAVGCYPIQAATLARSDLEGKCRLEHGEQLT